MSTQRTPPKFSSNPDLPTTVITTVEDTFFNIRKRKQPERDDIDERLNLFEQKFDNQFTTFGHKIDEIISEAVTSSIKSILTTELSKISATLESLNDTVKGLRSDNALFKESLNNINRRVTEMEESLIATDSRQNIFKTQLQTLKDQMKTTCNLPDFVQNLERKICFMEQQARECNLEIVNLPDRRGENLLQIVTNIGTAIQQQILPSDIVAVHRVPHADQKDTRPKNIIVKLSTKVLRDNIIAASRSVKTLNTELLGMSGPLQKIFLNEHLTIKNKHLFRECKSRTKAQGYKYIWVKLGIILVRKSDTSPVLAVRSEQDIHKIK